MDADLLIHDAQYTDEEYARCIGWGHSTYRHAFEFAARVGAKRIVPFHHDPSHDDETLDRLLDHALAAFKCPCAVSPGTFELGSYLVWIPEDPSAVAALVPKELRPEARAFGLYESVCC